jgi:hypothetical protein
LAIADWQSGVMGFDNVRANRNRKRRWLARDWLRVELMQPFQG